MVDWNVWMWLECVIGMYECWRVTEVCLIGMYECWRVTEVCLIGMYVFDWNV